MLFCSPRAFMGKTQARKGFLHLIFYEPTKFQPFTPYGSFIVSTYWFTIFPLQNSIHGFYSSALGFRVFTKVVFPLACIFSLRIWYIGHFYLAMFFGTRYNMNSDLLYYQESTVVLFRMTGNFKQFIVFVL